MAPEERNADSDIHRSKGFQYTYILKIFVMFLGHLAFSSCLHRDWIQSAKFQEKTCQLRNFPSNCAITIAFFPQPVLYLPQISIPILW